jgi:RimJ/RimL family protein N-acetyltransferase
VTQPEHAYAFADNAASRRVLAKVGLALVGEVLSGGVPQVRYEVT